MSGDEEPVNDDLVIRVIRQRGFGGENGPMVGRMGKRGRAIWTICGDVDTVTYCQDMAKDLGIEFEGVFEWTGERIE